MKINDAVRRQLWVQGALWVAVLLVLAGLLSWVAREYGAQWDVTANARNTLSRGTQEALRRMDGPVSITAYAIAHDNAGTDVHQLLRDKIKPWQRIKPDITLTLVDPRDDPRRANAAELRSPNELVIEHKQRSEHLPLADLNEQNLLNVLVRLSRVTNEAVYWLDGHGERKLDGNANHDLGEFGRQMRMKGYRFLPLNLAAAPDVPRNTAMLIIASPQTDLQDSEVAALRRYVEGGGNLLWLLDPEPLHNLDPLAEYLGLVLTPGTVVDTALRPRSGPPILAVASNYGRHPVTSSFTLNTLFPVSRQIGNAAREGWRATPLIEAAQRGWVETGPLDDNPTFDKDQDLRGPVNIATAFERTAGDKLQRVIVVGNGNFLSNTYLGNGGNLQLGMAMLSWLVGDDKAVALPPRPAADVQVDIDQMTLTLLAMTFLVGLPLAFAITGVAVWWRRRRAR